MILYYKLCNITTNTNSNKKGLNKLNKIKGFPVSDFERELSEKWAKGEITGSQMKAALIVAHKKI